MQSWDDEQLAKLRPMYEGFELWTVRNLYPRPHYTWCARRVGEATSCVVADSPEELVKALGGLSCRCPRHAAHEQEI